MHCCEHDVLDFFKHCQNDWKTKSDNLSTLRGWGVKGCLNFFQIVRGSFFSFFHFLDTWSLPSQLDWERSKCAHSQNCPQASNSHKQCGFRLKVFSLFDSNFSLLLSSAALRPTFPFICGILGIFTNLFPPYFNVRMNMLLNQGHNQMSCT